MKILIIAQHLFPIKTPRAHRVTELVKELARQKHTVVVYAVLGKHNYSDFEKEFGVTVKNIPIHYQWIPYSSDGDGRRALIDKVLGRLLQRRFEFPNIEFRYALSRIFKTEQQFDALISVSDPHHIHWGCAKAKIKYPNIFPKVWIADSGDPFMDNDKTKDHTAYFAKFEREFCKICDFITIPTKNAINGYYPEYAHKIKIIPQGFKFDLPIKQHTPQNEIITFAFAGVFYKDIRNPKQFLDFLVRCKLDFRFVVYTPYQDLLQDYIKPLADKLIINSPINRNELLLQLKNMDFLLNIENANSPNQTPSKLIDYAIVGRPILSINPTNLNTTIVNQFLERNYTNALVVDAIEQYHITNVTKKFIDLISEKK